MNPIQFFCEIGPAARESAKTSGIPASFVMAQAALESAWGESKLAKQAFNLFGVKAHSTWKGEILTLPTKEFVKGKWITVNARWRKYPDWLACIADHADFLHRNKRYAAAFKTCTGEDFACEVAKAGYATDPDYAKKVCSIIRRYNLAEHDDSDD